MIPAGIVAIAESGMKTANDVARVAAAGADAVLIGSELSASLEPEAAVRSLAGIPRARGDRKG
jgi:indole-3-glycerol phosphate synthase